MNFVDAFRKEVQELQKLTPHAPEVLENFPETRIKEMEAEGMGVSEAVDLSFSLSRK